jgi:CubicO group peptidase (beta-lactamase class C family)
MTSTRQLVLVDLVVFLAICVTPGLTVAQVPTSAVDSIFEAFRGTERPGCAVAVSEGGEQVLSRAYGMADLEHNVPNTAETVFEPGSVSKQFTAAATILLALDDKLSLDDDIREYIPELPDYGNAITIRHLLNHTSGYSYTNTGYNLQAILVERVSGMSFAEFSRVRIFEPLGMTRTEWRDDFTRIVEDRAIA